MMNKKGFTLVELLATIVVLALVMSIGAVTIVKIMENAREENYKLLINNIKSAAEGYYQECRYANYSGKLNCTVVSGGEQPTYELTLGVLVDTGYLKGNSTKETKEFTIVNPKDNKSIYGCKIDISLDKGLIKVTAVKPKGSCPTEY